MIGVNTTDGADGRTVSSARTLARRVALALSLPPTLAHELTHLLASLPWADRAGIVVDGATAECRVEWRDDAPTAGIVLAAWAPTVVGSLVGVVGLLGVVTGHVDAVREWLVGGAAAAAWVVYVAPSRADRETARDARDSTETTENTP